MKLTELAKFKLKYQRSN